MPCLQFALMQMRNIIYKSLLLWGRNLWWEGWQGGKQKHKEPYRLFAIVWLKPQFKILWFKTKSLGSYLGTAACLGNCKFRYLENYWHGEDRVLRWIFADWSVFFQSWLINYYTISLVRVCFFIKTSGILHTCWTGNSE